MKRRCTILLFSVFVIFFMTTSAYSKEKNVDAIIFDPVTDGGRYMTIHDAQTLGQWRFHFGGYFDYGHEPLEIRNLATGVRTGIVDDLAMGHFQAGLGFTNWAAAGVSVPVIFYEAYYDPNTVGAPKQTKSGIGDIRFEPKFMLLDNDIYPIGVAIIPFMTAPTGNRNFFLGNGKFTGGGKVAVEGNINHRVWISMNWGYQYMPGGKFAYFPPNSDAYIDDLLTFGMGVHGRINDTWSLLAEMYGETVVQNAFKSTRQTPIIGHGGARFSPQMRAIKGLSFTVAAGGGFTKGVGNPDFHIVGGINYRKPRIVELEEPGAGEAEVTPADKIIITQKIHFEFNKSIIRPISFPILDDVIELLKNNPQIARVAVEGHTDWIGSDAYNQRLSQSRARSVVDYLTSHGIDASRLQAVGYGESRPIADNNTTEGRAKNRRTEFTVMEMSAVK